MQENSTGALQVHPFFIWWLTTLASSSLHWDPVLSWKKKMVQDGRKGEQKTTEGERRRKKRGREGERRSKFRVGGEYARVCECGEDEKEDREKWGKWERHRVGEKRKREYIATVSGIFKNFFCRQQSRVAATASPHPVVMYRWLFWAPNIHRSFPCANPHPPLSYRSHLHPPPPSILFYRCVLFFCPLAQIQFLYCLFSPHLLFLNSNFQVQVVFLLPRVFVKSLVYSQQDDADSPHFQTVYVYSTRLP